MRTGSEVLVIGDALVDVTVQPATPIRTGADVPADVSLGFGGQGANLAIRLARQGVGVELVCGLGEDRAGAMVGDALRAEGIHLKPVRVAATGAVVVLLDGSGERTMLSQRAPFAVAAVSVLPSDADWIAVSGYLLLEADAEMLAGAVGARHSRRVILGCAMPSRAAARDWVAVASAMVPDLVIVSLDEAGDIEPGSALHARSVITSPAGAVAHLDGVSVEVRSPPGAPARDTTGAGDAFSAGLIASLLTRPWPPTAPILEAALTRAVTLGSAVAQAAGAQALVAGERDATLLP